MKKTIKIIDKIYEVRKDGKNSLYVNSVYSEVLFVEGFGRIAVKQCNGGLNFYRISKKLQRRFYHFIKNGYSVYAKGIYKYTKHFA